MLLLCMVQMFVLLVGTVSAIVSVAGSNHDVVYSAITFMALTTIGVGSYGLNFLFPS